MAKPNRYKQMEFYMTCSLAADLVLFVLYLVCAKIIWLKVILSLFILLLSALCLTLLYKSGELQKPRSLWMSTAFVAIMICLLFSLLLNFP